MACARIDPERHVQVTHDVLAEHAGRQAVGGVVGDRDGFLVALDPQDRRDGTEGLLVEDLHVPRDMVDG